YLMKNEVELARVVFRDMAKEQPQRLASIRNELLAIRSSELWEISDRGVNFDYLPPKRKRRMLEFFGWFGDRLPPLPERVSGEFLESSPTIPPSSAGTELSSEAQQMLSTVGIGADGQADPGRRPN
ncbi:MAG: hypothetical protein AB7P00_34795, partial [Sandaracinaceae bacterium]